MAASLSAYWVKFFKGAGFPQDVATKHAVVFSNNRIKPDMLPELDKPSLKEMGITLMGDMIAILRYAKKVVEETTCERFLVDSEDSVQTPKLAPKTVMKKIVSKVPNKTAVAVRTSKVESATTTKTVKPTIVPMAKTAPAKKASLVAKSTSSEHTDTKRQITVKRKLEKQEFDKDEDEEWSIMKKKVKTSPDESEDKVGYTVILPKSSTSRSQQSLKKVNDQKRTVFDRLGDSSVTSTTNVAEASTTFNITGLGRDVFKRSASVFNRLGDKDAKKDDVPQTGILKNGNNVSQGILKNWSPNNKTTIVGTKKILTKPIGTMRADHEVMKKNSSNVKQLISTKKITFNDNSSRSTKIMKHDINSGKLASERLTVPAKARLGLSGTKQVTFNRIATVTHMKKPDVFSRLGV